MKNHRLTLALACAGFLTAVPGISCAGELQDLKATLQRLQARIDQLEQSQQAQVKEQAATKAEAAAAVASAKAEAAAATAAAKAVAAAPAKIDPNEVATKGSIPGSIRIPGTNTSLKIGGFVQLDGIYDFKGNQGLAVSAGEIPLNGSAAAKRKGTTTFSARTSRLFFETATPSDIGDIKTKIEADFFTSEGSETYSNSARLRLRHAYGSVGNWLAGQTWSNFMDLSGMPETLEFDGPTGQAFIRQAQLRYTTALTDKQTLSVSVENPQSDARDNGGNVTAIDRGPDVTAKWQLNGDFGHFAVRGLYRPLRADDGNGNNQAQTNGWGMGVGGSLKLGANDTILYQVNAGEGIGRYIMDVYGSAAYDASTATLAKQQAIGGYVALQHLWSPRLRSTMSFNATHINNKSGYGDISGLNTDTRQVHSNLIWAVAPQMDVGVEYIWTARKVEGGAEGTSSRVQGAAIYRF